MLYFPYVFGQIPALRTIVAARRTPQTAPRTSGSCLLLHLTSTLRVAKMQDVHSLLVFRFAAKLSPVHSFLLRGINFAEVLFLWRIRSSRDLNGAAEPEPRNTPFLSRRKRRIRTFMNAPVRTGQDPYSDDKKKERRILSQEYAPFGIDIQVKARIVLPVQL